jgi:site-specific DNA-cytosine methylase
LALFWLTIQSFPDSFVFCSGMRETERQIGNAVPPVLAWHVANAAAAAIEKGRAEGALLAHRQRA